MNSKNIIPWVLVLVFGAAGIFLFRGGQTKEKELVELRQQTAEIAQLRSALEDAKKAEAQNAGVNLTENERKELIRLRSTVGSLRKETQDLSRVAQQTQQERDRLLQSQQVAAQQLQLQKQNQQLAQESEEQKIIKERNQCINNLRQLDGATQQWALENKQAANAAVVVEQLSVYFRNSTAPVCPSGGVYSMTTVEAAPACNIGGHALPAQ